MITMKTGIAILIYLSGYALAYLLFRTAIKKNQEWTVGARDFILCISIFSWLSFVSAGVILLIQRAANNDKKANW